METNYLFGAISGGDSRTDRPRSTRQRLELGITALLLAACFDECAVSPEPAQIDSPVELTNSALAGDGPSRAVATKAKSNNRYVSAGSIGTVVVEAMRVRPGEQVSLITNGEPRAQTRSRGRTAVRDRVDEPRRLSRPS
jgi:hypothetical protein